MSLPIVALVLVLAPGEALRARGNHAVTREEGPVQMVGLSPRFGLLRGGGAEVMQPYGFGVGFEYRVHALRVGPVRLGLMAHLGHTRYLDRRHVLMRETDRSVLRYAALGHSDFTAGPSIEAVIGPIVLQLACGVGVGISTFVRPFGALPNEEQKYDDTAFMLRGGGQVLVPIHDGHGVTIGVGVQRFFSKLRIPRDPPAPGADASTPVARDNGPFELMLELSLGYAFVF